MSNNRRILGDAANGATTVVLPDHAAKLARARRELRLINEGLRLWTSAEYLDRLISTLESLRGEKTTEPPSAVPPEESGGAGA